MRISSSTLYDVNVAALNQQQSKMLHTQQQVSSGRRMLTAADDPAAAASALNLTQSDATNTQYAKNIDTAQNLVAMSESTLQAVTTFLQDVQTVAVTAGNTGTMTNADRSILGNDLQARLGELVGLANGTDGLGNYLFSGFQGKTQPFVSTPAGVQYMGDDGQRLSQVNATRQLASSDSGADIFMRIKNGNGTFVTQAAAANTGSGIASLGNVVDPALLTGHNYQMDFTVAAGVTTYTVTDQSTLPLPTQVLPPLPALGVPYVSGQAINFDGMQLDIQGAPANGDQFTVVPSTNESVFKIISDLITTLNTPLIPGNAASATQFSSNLNRALNGLDRSLSNVLTIRASMGSRLNELDAVRSIGEDLSLQYKQALSLLQDVDYNKAITDLTQQQTGLQAAQKSFLQVMNLSMFNYM